jgi:hypothetical protein
MPKEKFADRYKLYNAGLSDTEIARELGLKQNTITAWRKSRRLAPHERRGFTPAQGAARMLLYQLGWSDHHIAREQRVGRRSVGNWRAIRKLPANFRVGVNERNQPRPSVQSIAVRIRKAVGRSLSPDIIEDTVSDMMVAVLDGELPLRDIESKARRYGNRVLDRFASKFGPRSLDQELGSEEGFTLMDTLVDQSSSSWLEEMGATVW